jgi:hypothetical protein
MRIRILPEMTNRRTEPWLETAVALRVESVVRRLTAFAHPDQASCPIRATVGSPTPVGRPDVAAKPFLMRCKYYTAKEMNVKMNVKMNVEILPRPSCNRMTGMDAYIIAIDPHRVQF